MPVKTEVSLLISTLAISTAVILYWQWRRHRKVFVKVGTVKRLLFYPIKSLKGIDVDEVQCDSRGIECFGMQERSFMLINDKDVLISQREEPSLVLLKIEVSGDKIILRSTDGDPLELNWKTDISSDETTITCQLHRDIVQTVDCGGDAAKWFQNYLNRSDVRLVRYSPVLPDRVFVGKEPIHAQCTKDFPVLLQDFAAFHVCSQSSLDELNLALERKVSILNYRPNVLIEGAPAFDEDNWESLKFSSGAEMCSTLPCGRCLLTTNDPETGMITYKEMLSTLRKFRMPKRREITKLVQHSPCFGIHCWLQKAGNIRVGDDMFAVRQRGLFEFK